MNYLLSGDDVKRFLESCFKRVNCYYTWPDKSNQYSGKDLKGASYSDVYDCSGLVTASLYESSGTAIDHRATWNANRLMKACAEVSDPKPGDLCFYGPSRGVITHVMVYIGMCYPRPDNIPKEWRVFGASGGGRTTLSPEIAKEQDAKVTGYKSHLYRPDFIAFGRLFKDE